MATVSIGFPPESATVAVVNGVTIPELVTIPGTTATNAPVITGYAFGVANEGIFFRFTAMNYGASNPNVTVLLDWMARTTATVSGSVTWGAALSVLTPGDAQSMITDGIATENTQSSTTSSTGNGPTRCTITVTNLDSLAAGDTVLLRIRSTAFTSFTGDALLFGVTVQYPDT